MSLRFYAPYTRIPGYVAAEINNSLRSFSTPITMVNAQNGGVATLRSMLEQRYTIETTSTNRLVSVNGSTPSNGFVFFVQGVMHPMDSDINTIFVAPGNIVELIGR